MNKKFIFSTLLFVSNNVFAQGNISAMREKADILLNDMIHISSYVLLALLFLYLLSVIYNIMSDDSEEEKKNVKKDNDIKKIQQNTISQVVDKPIVKEQVIEPTLFSKIKNESFYDIAINISNEIKVLQNHDSIKQDIQKQLDLKNIDTIYLPKIINNFLDTELNSRSKLLSNNMTISQMTIKQLQMLESHIQHLKEVILEEQMYKIQVNDIFLENKFNPKKHETFVPIELEKE